MKQLPSLICIIAQQRTLVCSSCTSLQHKNKSQNIRSSGVIFWATLWHRGAVTERVWFLGCFFFFFFKHLTCQVPHMCFLSKYLHLDHLTLQQIRSRIHRFLSVKLDLWALLSSLSVLVWTWMLTAFINKAEALLSGSWQTYSQEDVLQTAGHLPLNAVLNVSSRNLLILLEHWGEKTGTQNTVKLIIMLLS